ncbi:MAG: hypothetical protein ACI4UE_06980 [Candidatus Scatovivens sp.]
MSNVLQNEREKLSVEQFLKYKKYISIDADNVIFAYAMKILIEEPDITLEKIYNLFIKEQDQEDYSFEDFEEDLNQSFEAIGLKFLECSSEQILEKLPDELESELLEFKSEFISQYKEKGYSTIIEIDSNEKYIYLVKKFEEIQKEIGTYDLSEIPPEMFFDITTEGLRNIDFENTGAKLDMQHMQGKKYASINGSIKGCKLISYNPNCYNPINMIKKEDGKLTGDYIRDENGFYVLNIDEEQIPAILEYYKEHKEDRETLIVATLIGAFLAKENIQKDYTWLLEDYMKYVENDNLFMLPNVWKCLSEEYQERFFDVVEKLIEKENFESYDTSSTLIKILRNTHANVIKEFEEKLEKKFIKDDGKFDFKKYATSVWRYLPEEYKEKNLFNILERKNGNIYDLEKLFKNCTTETQKKQFPKVFETLMIKDDSTNDTRVDLIKIYNFMMDKNEYGISFTGIGNIIGEKEATKIYEALKENQDLYINNKHITLESFWPAFDEEIQKKFLTDILLKQGNNNEYKKIWRLTAFEVKKDLYFEVLEKIDEENKDLKAYFKGIAYIDLLNGYPEKEKYEIMQKDPQKYISAIYYFEGVNIPENIENLSDSYTLEELKVLEKLYNERKINSTNIDKLVYGIPSIGHKLTTKIIFSNSEMIRKYSTSIIATIATLPEEKRNSFYNEIESIFTQNLPSFVKIYQYYQMSFEGKIEQKINGSTSPSLINAEDRKKQNRIIFSDLFRIAMDSNNKSLRDFVRELETGNKLYIKLVENGEKIDSLSKEEQLQLQRYLKSLYILYDLTENDTKDEKLGEKIEYSGNIEQDAKNLSRKYSTDGKIQDLPDKIIESIVGPLSELFDGIDTISDINRYMEERVKQTNAYHRNLAEREIVLGDGDLVEGVKSGFSVFPDIIRDGILAGDLLGVHSVVDSTYLGADFGMFSSENESKPLNEKLQDTLASRLL